MTINECRDRVLEILSSKGVTIKSIYVNDSEYYPVPVLQNEIDFNHENTYYWLYMGDDGTCGWYVESNEPHTNPSGCDYEDFQFTKVIEFVENTFK